MKNRWTSKFFPEDSLLKKINEKYKLLKDGKLPPKSVPATINRIKKLYAQLLKSDLKALQHAGKTHVSQEEIVILAPALHHLIQGLPLSDVTFLKLEKLAHSSIRHITSAQAFYLEVDSYNRAVENYLLQLQAQITWDDWGYLKNPDPNLNYRFKDVYAMNIPKCVSVIKDKLKFFDKDYNTHDLLAAYETIISELEHPAKSKLDHTEPNAGYLKSFISDNLATLIPFTWSNLANPLPTPN
jgi:hypothetical protein